MRGGGAGRRVAPGGDDQRAAARAREQARGRGGAELAVEDHPQRSVGAALGPGPPHRQAADRRPAPCRRRPGWRRGPRAARAPPRGRRARDPVDVAGGRGARGDEAVQGGGDLQGDPGAAVAHPAEEAAVLRAALGLPGTRRRRACRPGAAARRRGPSPAGSRRGSRPPPGRTRRRSPPAVRTGPCGRCGSRARASRRGWRPARACPARPSASISACGRPARWWIAPGQHASRPHHHGAHDGIGPGAAAAPLGQGQGHAHEAAVVLAEARPAALTPGCAPSTRIRRCTSFISSPTS